MVSELTREEAFEYISSVKMCDMQEKDFKEIFLDMCMDYRSKVTSEATKRKAVLESVRYEFRGAPNKFVASYIKETFGENVIVKGKLEVLLPCPCCGARSLTELYDPKCGTGYDICEYCRWEDDGTADLKQHSSVNKGSMLDYRKKLPITISDNPRWIFVNMDRDI